MPVTHAPWLIVLSLVVAIQGAFVGLSLAVQVGELKRREGTVAFRPEREAQVIDGLKALNPGPLKSDSVAPIWEDENDPDVAKMYSLFGDEAHLVDNPVLALKDEQ